MLYRVRYRRPPAAGPVPRPGDQAIGEVVTGTRPTARGRSRRWRPGSSVSRWPQAGATGHAHRPAAAAVPHGDRRRRPGYLSLDPAHERAHRHRDRHDRALDQHGWTYLHATVDCCTARSPAGRWTCTAATTRPPAAWRPHSSCATWFPGGSHPGSGTAARSPAATSAVTCPPGLWRTAAAATATGLAGVHRVPVRPAQEALLASRVGGDRAELAACNERYRCRRHGNP